MNSADRSRYQWSYTGTWTRTMGSTVLDTSFATNRFNQIDKLLGLKQFKPTDVGLPSYLDEFCSTHGGCIAALDRDQRLSGDRRRAVGRRYRDAHPGAVVDHVGQRAAYAARRRRRPARPARPDRRRQPLGAAHVRSHLHAAVQRREHADAEQPRTVAGRLRTGPADLGVDQRRAAVAVQQLLDGRLRSGHLASRRRSPSTRVCGSSTRPACGRRTAT